MGVSTLYRYFPASAHKKTE
ncbi:hypothetical protein ACE01J_07935 [Salmonella enterica subsp. enterica serovar Infantis]